MQISLALPGEVPQLCLLVRGWEKRAGRKHNRVGHGKGLKGKNKVLAVFVVNNQVFLCESSSSISVPIARHPKVVVVDVLSEAPGDVSFC